LLPQPSGCKRTDFSDRFVEKSSTVTKTHVPLKLDGFDLGYVGGFMYF